MKPHLLSGILFFGLILIACGGKDDDNTAESNEPKNMVESLQDAQKQLQKMSEGNGADFEPINFRDLQKTFPDNIKRFDKVDYSGSTSGTMGFNVSTASAQYSDGGDKRVDLDLTDAGGIGQATMALAAWSMASIDKEDKQGYERTGTYQGYKSYERYNRESNRSEISIFIEDRLVLSAKANNMDMKDLKDFLSNLDLGNFKSLL